MHRLRIQILIQVLYIKTWRLHLGFLHLMKCHTLSEQAKTAQNTQYLG